MKTTNPIPSRPQMPSRFTELAEVLMASDSLRVIYQPYGTRIVFDAITNEVVPAGKTPRYQVRNLIYNVEIMTKEEDGKWSSIFLPPQFLGMIAEKVKMAQSIEYLVDTWED
jgi:hypothetical protein